MDHLPRAILFDLDNTIICAATRRDIWSTVIAEFAGALAPLAVADVAARTAAIARGYWTDPEVYRKYRYRLREGRRAMIAAALAQAAAAAGIAVPAGLDEAISDRVGAIREADLHVFPGARETLEQVFAAGVRMALVTNGAGEVQRAKIERFDLAGHFHHIQIEGEHGFGKPEERAYRHAMATLGVGAHECWMVGDNLEWEVVAPQRLGIHAIWHDFNGEGLPAGSTVRPDRIIRRLTELLEPG